MNTNLTRTSKFLSLVLRHRPEVIGLRLDAEGWLDINELIASANQRGTAITLEQLHEVVATCEKRRFALSDDGLRVRANQGHSVADVELNLPSTQPPDQLFHGTVAVFLDSIREQGLRRRSRNHVHLSADRETATKVGSRRGVPVILAVNAGEMNDAGHVFYRSANGVWLTNHVPPRFLAFPEN
ncbi:RNA 2'-phosphotransferase [Aporhodopirellula aestuarii]|uniref:Probable RNA 2'-phosphotransferase n=1 Tax=Aporhodopirellula aestuarii TaxID=2950107 RepID=A0ABT0U6P4_9BACT|nr:RNA 2'-phosphotransferase [Aporhodopirellula aestuarii]MCM2372068.1 RNA 2'-phosphotransferase [Aporhodopirellula aestuarii]